MANAELVNQVYGLLDAEECAALIRRAESSGFSPTAGAYPRAYRNNDRLVLDDAALALALFERLRPHLPARLERAGVSWRLSGLNPRFRFCRYQRGQAFCVHRDGAYAPTPGCRSYFTCQVYLSAREAHRGGSTRFYDQHAESGRTCLVDVQPERGKAIIFAHDVWHDGAPVERGVKYVLRTDALYVSDAVPEPTGFGYIWRLASAPDGTLLVATRDQKLWRIREPSSPGREVLVSHGASITALAVAPDGSVFTGDRMGVVKRTTAAGSVELRPAAAAILDATWDPAREAVALACADGAVRYRGGSRDVHWMAHEGWVHSVSSTPQGLVTAGDDGTLVLWGEGTAPRGEVLYRSSAPMRAGLWSSALGFVAGDALGKLHSSAGVEERHAAAVTALMVHEASATILSGSEDGCVRIGEQSMQHPDFVRCLLVHRGELLSGGYDCVVHGHRLPSPRPSPEQSAQSRL